MKYRKRRSQYINLKTDEGILATVMVLLIVASIVALLVGSIIELHPSLPEGMPATARIISVVLFTIGIILLISKVYLHGKEID
jgi:hydrogenase-4 membrane subunit HyfE